MQNIRVAAGWKLKHAICRFFEINWQMIMQHRVIRRCKHKTAFMSRLILNIPKRIRFCIDINRFFCRSPSASCRVTLAKQTAMEWRVWNQCASRDNEFEFGWKQRRKNNWFSQFSLAGREYQGDKNIFHSNLALNVEIINSWLWERENSRALNFPLSLFYEFSF